MIYHFYRPCCPGVLAAEVSAETPVEMFHELRRKRDLGPEDYEILMPRGGKCGEITLGGEIVLTFEEVKG